MSPDGNANPYDHSENFEHAHCPDRLSIATASREIKEITAEVAEWIERQRVSVGLLTLLHPAHLRVAADPSGSTYTDQAMAPVDDGELESLELFTHTKAAREAVDHARKVKLLTA